MCVTVSESHRRVWALSRWSWAFPLVPTRFRGRSRGLRFRGVARLRGPAVSALWPDRWTPWSRPPRFRGRRGCMCLNRCCAGWMLPRRCRFRRQTPLSRGRAGWRRGCRLSRPTVKWKSRCPLCQEPGFHSGTLKRIPPRRECGTFPEWGVCL